MLYRVIYTLLLLLFFPLIALTLYKPQQGKKSFGKRWPEHFGITPPLAEHSGSPIWIHAVSVGEVVASIPLIKQLRVAYPERDIVVTTTTATGGDIAKTLGDRVYHRYMPLDFPWCVQAFIKKINPAILLIMETELWPNTLYQAQKTKLPILVLNARLSERSCQRYQRLPSIFTMLSQPISHLACQYADDAKRFARLGIPQDKLSVTGSMKFDLQIPEHLSQAASMLRAQFSPHSAVWIAASTHKGEDEQILATFKLVRQTLPDCQLILVPRHPQRFDDVAKLCTDQGWSLRRRSLNELPENSDIYLGDTMGELLMLFKASDLAFIGGSLLPIGGHNLLEPAAVGIPSIIGPYYFNFTDITEKLIHCKATQVCHNSTELADLVVKLLQDPESRHQQGQAGADLVADNQGATRKILQTIEQYLPLS
ncbi:3-deoxy-D-manno-octulosonic acid transferase [Plesiomonas shigelloides]|uniref:lipid IV(A) 3-deoxy-D-manno-octulosonic acid transferase n=1 Tax=Plesiomonas shigelloides TaxID=703 RepID=UPI001262164E|nr:lipid IV(A) 3-deoxy-D-manno-octulosonic acid transferase [Plesiomonas shigelloides]KAB7702744.1 3-deoxy-D-manno-octulosonic acid transferase [Plesiomonas shigelloides]MCX2533817.1 lipid IV(A) 3-deoxy-D-manno-octulosonic acid transferase [Plesiomonas shigelloides]